MSFSLKGFLVGITVLPVLAIASTPPAYQWHTFFGGDAGDGANKPATVVDAYGNLYVTGWTQYPWDQYGNPGSFIGTWVGYLTKVSPTGQLLWSKFYPGYGQSSSGLQPTAIALDSAGNIYLAGNGNVINDGNYGCFVMETDPEGNMTGGANIGYSNYGRTCAVYDLAYDSANNYMYITGSATGGWQGGEPVDNGGGPNGSLPANQAGAMFILQTRGVAGGMWLGWVGFYFTPPGGSYGNTYGQSIAVDASSNLIVAGNDNGNVAVWKVSNTGTQAWESVFGTGFSYAVAVNGSNVYATGYSGGGWNGPAGQAPLNAFAYGGAYVCCRAVAFVLKLDTNGNYLWHTFYYGNEEQSIGEGIALDGASTVYVDGPGDIVGYNNAAPLHNTASTGGGGHFLLQLNDAGAYQWHTLYGVLKWDEASSIAVDPEHDVYVSGWSGYTSWNADNNTPPLHAGSLAASEIFVMKFSPVVATTTTTSAPPPIVYSPSPQPVTLSATVTSASTVNSGTVSFTLLGTTVSANVVNGSASANFTVPGGTAAGAYTIQATYNPGPGLAGSSDSTHQLRIANAANVSAQVTVTQTGFARNRATGYWSATMTVTNTSATAISSPVQVVLTNLTAGVTMVNGSGTSNGSPYITVSTVPLAPGAAVSVTIQFLNPSNGSITYTPVTYAGGLF
jgi:hypothetical protein